MQWPPDILGRVMNLNLEEGEDVEGKQLSNEFLESAFHKNV